jgi:hypothetical protein
MKSILATACTLAVLSVMPASAQSGDPKLDFLGYCIEQGQPTAYCGCLTDEVAAKTTPHELDVYLYYLKLIASGERDQAKIISNLKKKAGTSGKELAALLQKVKEAADAAQKVCS